MRAVSRLRFDADIIQMLSPAPLLRLPDEFVLVLPTVGWCYLSCTDFMSTRRPPCEDSVWYLQADSSSSWDQGPDFAPDSYSFRNERQWTDVSVCDSASDLCAGRKDVSANNIGCQSAVLVHALPTYFPAGCVDACNLLNTQSSGL